MPPRTFYALRDNAAKYYKTTYETILGNLASGSLLHADETQVSVGGKSAYVWVFTNLEEAAYLYAESRDGSFLQEMLKDFRGVIVSDFYGAYDSLPCCQQKCLVHLMRDLNDEVLCRPYDEGLKGIVKEFAELLKGIVETGRQAWSQGTLSQGDTAGRLSVSTKGYSSYLAKARKL